MSKEIYFDFVANDVLVDHPFEPVRFNPVMADILVFRHCSYGSVYDASPLIVKYLYGEISFKSLYQDYGICVLKLFHDICLRSLTFSICKEYFDYFECSCDYDYYLNKFVTSKVNSDEK